MADDITNNDGAGEGAGQPPADTGSAQTPAQAANARAEKLFNHPSSKMTGAAADAAVDEGETQTLEQIAAAKVASDAEAERVAAFSPEAKLAEEKAAADQAADAPLEDYSVLFPEQHREVFTEFSDLMKEANLPAALADKLSTSIQNHLQASVIAGREAQAAEHAAEWNRRADLARAETLRKFSDEDRAKASAALVKVFDKETIKSLHAMRLTDSPLLAAAMPKIAKGFGFGGLEDDRFVNGSSGAGDRSSGDARRFFPRSDHNP